MRIKDSVKQITIPADSDIWDLVNSVDKAFLVEVIDTLSFPRHYIAERSNNNRARNWIADVFRSFGYNVVMSGPFHNVVATPPRFTNGPKILIGSHYDTVPGSPGADDNASAVAVSLACAKADAVSPWAAPVIFVSFNREEDNLLGSKQFVAEHLPNCEEQISLAHVLEMVGYRVHQPGSQRLPPGLPIQAPDVGDFLAILANRTSNRCIKPLLREAKASCPGLHVLGMQVYLGMEKYFPHLLRSDHAPFWRSGIPALMWTDTSEFRNPNYHMASDTLDTLDFEFMKQVTQLLLATIHRNGQKKSPNKPLHLDHKSGVIF